MTEYDPTTCSTAGDLRSIGIAIPENIPDCAWIPRNAWHINYHHAAKISADRVTIAYTVNITEPFRWEEANTITKP